MPVNVALARGLALARPVPKIETIPLNDAFGRVLAEDILAPFPLPPFDDSAMDGYAIRSSEVTGDGPWRVLPDEFELVCAGTIKLPLR